jgi:metal-responsive CopG/Arc/MetJ family transcriptional regulator
MATAVKKTISLPPDLAHEAETIAKEEGKTLSAFIQDALRLARKEKMKREFQDMQGYWSRKARDKGILTEKDLEKYLKK